MEKQFTTVPVRKELMEQVKVKIITETQKNVKSTSAIEYALLKYLEME